MWSRVALPLRTPPQNPRELAGWPGTHSPCSPSPSRQVIYSTKKAPSRRLFHACRSRRPSADGRQARSRSVMAVDPVPVPGLGKADTRPGTGTGSTACETAPEQILAKARESARRTPLDAGTSASVRLNVRHAGVARAPWPTAGSLPRASCRVMSRSVPAPRDAACAVSRASDPGPFPGARVCLSKLGGRSRVGCLHPAPDRQCMLALCRASPGVQRRPAAAARAAGWSAGNAPAGIPSGRPAPAGLSGRCIRHSSA